LEVQVENLLSLSAEVLTDLKKILLQNSIFSIIKIITSVPAFCGSEMSMAISNIKTTKESVCSGTFGAFKALKSMENMTACRLLELRSFLGSS
jgi:hypothetical protein